MIIPLRSKSIKICLKIFVSLGIVYYLFSKVSFEFTKDLISEVRLSYIILAMILYFFAQMLSAYKWSVIASSLGFRHRYLDFFSYYFIGMFFNLFMLGSIGGDVIKAFYLSSGRKDVLSAGYSIFFDRFLGALALITILGFASLYVMKDKALSLWIPVSIISGSIIVWVFTLLLPRIMELFYFFKRWGKALGLDKLKLFWDKPILVFYPLIISFLFQMLFVCVIILVGKGFDIHVPLRYFFVFVPLSALLSSLPITLNGLGLREGVYVFFLNYLDVETSRAVIFSFLSTAVMWGVSLAGGIVYILKGRKRMVSSNSNGKNDQK